MISKDIKVKWIKVLIVLGFLCIVVAAFNLIFKTKGQNGEQITAAETRTQNKGLQLYLVKDGSAASIDDKTDINQLELENEPLLSGSDIVSYNWDLHCMEVKNGGKISRKLLKRRFVMMADGERIYSGAFWSALFSMYPPKISVYLDNIDESGDFVILALGGWRPGEKITPDAEKILGDSRIQKVLERDNQMYKAYKPGHFERPDYINISDHGESYGYGGGDWEKTDQLLRLLDQRFVQKLDYVRSDLSLKDDASLAALYEETMIILGYDEQRELIYNIRGTDRKFACKELIMPVTGDYGNLLYFSGNNGYEVNPLGSLEKFKEMDMLKRDPAREEQAYEGETEGIHLVYYKGGPFEHKPVCYYELERDEAKRIEEEAALGELLKGAPPHDPQPTSLMLGFGKNSDQWFRVYNDGETLFSEGKYYHNPALSGRILDIARRHCGYEIFDTSAFKGLVKAKYSFRTPTRTMERDTEDKVILAEMEKELQKARHNMGGGCPFYDGVLALTLEDGSVMEISMASDDCPLMFSNGNFLEYSDRLHDLLISTFDNFPRVRE